MSEEAKAAQEIAKTAGKAIDAASKAGGFIARFVSGPLEQGVGIWEDRLRYARWERQLRLMRRAEDFLKASGLQAPTRAIPLKLAVPLLQGGSLEDDDELQDRWAALLVNAANADAVAVQRSYLAILEQLSPLEAKILDVIYALPYEEIRHAGATTNELPALSRVVVEDGTRIEEPMPDPPEEVCIALGNLVRLGCLRLGLAWGGGELFRKVLPTVLGRSFVQACALTKQP